jgi:hypothetical protein
MVVRKNQKKKNVYSHQSTRKGLPKTLLYTGLLSTNCLRVARREVFVYTLAMLSDMADETERYEVVHSVHGKKSVKTRAGTSNQHNTLSFSAYKHNTTTALAEDISACKSIPLTA